jgi:anthranilate phosphoribosyltransferase
MTAAIITGLRVKKETVGEITGAARVMRELSAKVDAPPHPHFLDIVGTGGDGISSFNISTASMFVAAAAGARIAKHGGRSVSSKSGSADVLEALGARIDLSPAQVAECMVETDIGFMYAPNHHPAMKVVAPVRKEMGVRTLFNILGPLTNPANAPNILMGVFHPDLVGIQVRALQALGAQHAMVVGELRNGEVHEYEIEPEDYGLAMASSRNLRVENVTESKRMLLDALQDRHGVPHDIVCLNAGAALYTCGLVGSVASGIELARATVASGAAHAKMEAFVATTRRLADTAEVGSR